MFSHVMLGTNDIERSKRFYDAVLGVLGVGQPARNTNKTGQQRLFYRHEGTSFCISEPLDGLSLGVFRTAMVIGADPAAMRSDPADNAAVKWQLEPGVIGRLGDCEAGWCAMEIDRRDGFVRADRLWGAGAI